MEGNNNDILYSHSLSNVNKDKNYCDNDKINDNDDDDDESDDDEVGK